MQETRILAQFVSETSFSDLPDTLVAECRIAVLDTLAAGFIGTAQPWAQRAVALARELGGRPEATVIHQDWRIDVARAAFANGVLIGAFECEPLTGSHACGPLVYDQAAVDDPIVRDLAQRLELLPDASLHAGHGVFPATVTIETADQTFSLPTEPCKGSPSNPMTWADACEKFRRYTQPFIREAQANRIIDAVAVLDRGDPTHVKHLAKLTAAAS